MPIDDVAAWLDERPLVLGAGSIYERLRRDPAVEYDDHVAHAGLIYQPGPARVISDTLLEYIEVAQDGRLPMLLSTATWKASAPRIARSGFAGRDLNGDQTRFLRELLRTRAPALDCLVAGAMGSIGDAYKPAEGLDEHSAQRVHAPQIEALCRAGVDLIVVWTLPAAPEARGLAAALAAAGIPYVLSFVVRDSGTLLDGTMLTDVITAIDDAHSRPPLGYFINCVHPDVASAALDQCARRDRVIGFKSNTSSLRPEQLAQADELITEAPATLAAAIVALRARHPMRFIGGCCGTTTAHMKAIAAALTG